jgi:hypothetical protein
MEIKPDDAVVLLRHVLDQVTAEPSPQARAAALLALRAAFNQEWPRVRNEAVYRLRASGVPNKDIARMFRVDKHTAAIWTKAHSDSTGALDIRTIRNKTMDLKPVRYVVE